MRSALSQHAPKAVKRVHARLCHERLVCVQIDVLFPDLNSVEGDVHAPREGKVVSSKRLGVKVVRSVDGDSQLVLDTKIFGQYLKSVQKARVVLIRRRTDNEVCACRSER